MYFVGIGAQKAGTTTLARLLDAHKEIAFSPIKELHYFDEKHIDTFSIFENIFENRFKTLLNRFAQESPLGDAQIARIKTLNDRVCLSKGRFDYPTFFKRQFDLSQYKCWGEITPAYALLPVKGFKEIYNFYPNAKIIFILRDPIDRIKSHIRFEKKRKYRTFLEKPLTKIALDPEFGDRSRYDLTLNRLLEVFPKKNIHVCFFDDLVSHQQDFFDGICDFLNVSRMTLSKGLLHNKSKASLNLEQLDEEPLLEMFESTYKAVASFVDRPLPRSWKRSGPVFLNRDGHGIST